MNRSPTFLRAARPALLSIAGLVCISSPAVDVADAAPPPGLWLQQQPAAAAPSTEPSATRTAQADDPPAGEPAHLPEHDLMRKMIRDEVNKMQRPFEFKGYLRSGFGFNGKLGDQDAFQAVNAPQKYRLGNETETYGEAIFINNWIRPETAADSLFFKTEILLTFVTENNSNFDASDVFTIREAFGQAGGVIESAPDLKFWAGQRYYHRLDTHIHDFFYLSMSGYGGGFEDLELGSAAAGKLAGGYFGASTGTRAPDDPAGTDNGRPVKHVVDLRLEDVQLAGQATFWVAGSHYQGGDLPDGSDIPESDGFAVGVVHTIPDVLGGFNKVVLQFGTGPLIDYDVFFKVPADQEAAPNKAATVDEAYRIRALDVLLIEMAPTLSFMGTAVYQLTDYGSDGGADKETWISIGGRPIYHFTDYLNLAFEAGFDYTSADADLGGGAGELSGWLTKLTVAPQIQAGRNFWGRPALRAYFTYAFWADDFEGRVGGPAYVNDTAGIGAGLQMESWW